MSPRAALTTLALLLLLVPPVQAAGNVDLRPDGNSCTSCTATVSPSGASIELGYHLDLDESGNVELLSVVEEGGDYLDHQATWTGDGFSGKQTTRTTTATVDGLSTDDTMDLTVLFTLPAGSEAGTTYNLRAYVRHRGASGGNAALTDIDFVATTVTLFAPEPTGAGGGGGGGDFGTSIGPVTGLSARDVTGTGLRLSWDALSATGVSYQVYRSTQAGFEPSEATIVRTVTATQVADTGLVPETTYRYRVRGIDPAGGQTGPYSAELSVRTGSGLDTTAPDAVTGLRVDRTTPRSIALSWSEGHDNRAVTSYTLYRGSPGFTPSAGNRVTSTSALSYTDTNVVASTTYSYILRAVDAAGNIGPPSAPVEARTQADGDAPAPTVNRVVLIDAGQGWRLQWGSDQRAVGSVLLTGPDVQRSVQAGSGASFSATLGELPIGEYAYDITVTGDSGKVTQRSGRFLVEAGLHGRLEAVGDPVAEALSTRVGAQLDGLAVYFVDADLDGTVDRVVDADGRLTMERAFPAQRHFLVAARGTSLLLGTDGRIDPVEGVSADVLASATGDAVHRVTVRIDDKSGWLVATLDDPSPERPLLGIERADGTALPDGSAWRAGSKIRFLDDPAQEYVLLFDNSPSARISPESDGNGLPGWLPWVAGGAGVLLGMLLMAVLLRRRPA